MKRNTKGFTLIELLIVVVIIGILAAIAIPKFAATKEKAYLATMKSDLHNLETAQEGYASNNSGTYVNTGTVLGPDSLPALAFSPSAGVTVTIAAGANGTSGWSATATHANAPGKTCAIFVNTTPVAPATQEGVPGCN